VRGHPSSSSLWPGWGGVWGASEGFSPPQLTTLGDPNLLGTLDPNTFARELAWLGGSSPPPRSLLCSLPAAADAGDAPEDPEADEGLALAPSSSSSWAPSPIRTVYITLHPALRTNAAAVSPSPAGQSRGDSEGTGHPARGSPVLATLLPRSQTSLGTALSPELRLSLFASQPRASLLPTPCPHAVSLVPVSPRAACSQPLRSAWPWLEGRGGVVPAPQTPGCPAVGDGVAPPRPWLAQRDSGSLSPRNVTHGPGLGGRATAQGVLGSHGPWRKSLEPQIRGWVPSLAPTLGLVL